MMVGPDGMLTATQRHLIGEIPGVRIGDPGLAMGSGWSCVETLASLDTWQTRCYYTGATVPPRT
jgi:hypothetical protein